MGFTVLRAIRLIRLLRIERYLGAVEILVSVFKSRSVSLVVSGFMLCAWTLIFATLLHNTEKDNQQVQGITKETMAFRFRSVPSSLWFTFLHLTGDYPLFKYTNWGRLVNVFMIIFGQILIGLPIGIIIDGFQAEIEAANKASKEVREAAEAAAGLSKEEEQSDTELEVTADEKPADKDEQTFQEKTFAILHDRGMDTIYFNIVQSIAILLAFANLLIQSDKGWRNTEMFPDEGDFTLGALFKIIGYICASFFVVEYAVRVYACPVDPKFDGGDAAKFTGEKWKDWAGSTCLRRTCYITDFFGVVDLLAWVPFFIAQGFDVDSDAFVIIGSIQVAMLIKFDRMCPAFTLSMMQSVKRTPVPCLCALWCWQ